MTRRTGRLVLLVAALAALLPAVEARARPTLPTVLPGLRAGVAVVDASWRVGAGSGQYTEKEPDVAALATNGFVDPFHHSTLQRLTQVSKMTRWDTSQPTDRGTCASKQACSSDASSKPTIDTGFSPRPRWRILSCRPGEGPVQRWTAGG